MTWCWSKAAVSEEPFLAIRFDPLIVVGSSRKVAYGLTVATAVVLLSCSLIVVPEPKGVNDWETFNLLGHWKMSPITSLELLQHLPKLYLDHPLARVWIWLTSDSINEMYENGYGGIFSSFCLLFSTLLFRGGQSTIIGVNCPFGSEHGGKYLTLPMTTELLVLFKKTQ